MDHTNGSDDTEPILSWGAICARCKGPVLKAGSQPAADDRFQILKGKSKRAVE